MISVLGAVELLEEPDSPRNPQTLRGPLARTNLVSFSTATVGEVDLYELDDPTGVTDRVGVDTGVAATYMYNSGAISMSELSYITKNSVTTSFTFDPNGNVDTKTGGWDYDWNAGNLMTITKVGSVQQQAYAYDGLGRRVRVDGTSPSTWTVSIVAGMDVIYEKTNTGAVTKYVYANGMRIAKIPSTGAVQYFLADHLGSTRKVLDSSRNTVFSTEYEPFGKPVNVTGTESYKYTMERHDDPTGFVYLRARQYDPEIGRFVSADPVLGSLAVPQTLNRYAYVVNNPLKYTDPTGEAIWFIAAAVVIGLITCVTLWCTSPLGSEDFWMGLSLTPGLDVVGDAGFVWMDCTRAAGDPTWETIGTCALDFGLMLVPFAGVGLVKGGGRILGSVPWNRVDDIPGRHVDEFIDPRTLRFGQDSISPRFRSPRTDTVFDLAEDLRLGKVNPSDIPAIRVHRTTGITMDNRRLVAFQIAGRPIPVTYVDDIPQWMVRGSGNSIWIRGVGMWDPWRGLY